MNEIENAIEIICNRADHRGKKLENRNFEITQKEHRFKNNKESLCDLWLFINTYQKNRGSRRKEGEGGREFI